MICPKCKSDNVANLRVDSSIEVNNTKSNSTAYPDGLGRNYGIGYVFGGF